MNRSLPLFVLSALLLLTAPMAAQAKEAWESDTGRDVHFDNNMIFTDPWLWPVDLDSLVPTPNKGPKPTYAQSWLATSDPQKRYFLTGFGDMVLFRCLQQFGGDNPHARACAAALIPLPPTRCWPPWTPSTETPSTPTSASIWSSRPL